MRSDTESLECADLHTLLRAVPEVVLLGELRDGTAFLELVRNPSFKDLPLCVTSTTHLMARFQQHGHAAPHKDKP